MWTVGPKTSLNSEQSTELQSSVALLLLRADLWTILTAELFKRRLVAVCCIGSAAALVTAEAAAARARQHAQARSSKDFSLPNKVRAISIE